MLEFIEKNKTYVMILAILFVFVSLSGPTYSLFIKTDTIDNLEYETGLLDLQFTEDEKIVLDSALPINDSEATDLKPYVLKIKNTGNLTYHYKLKMKSTSDNSISDKYIKVKVNDNLPKTLYLSDNIIADDLIINPGEEKTFKINIWLDKDTPNDELGKYFTSDIIATGEAIYKTLDRSGANYPDIKDEMIPVYYNSTTSKWQKATASNLDSDNLWYNYDEAIWANSVSIIDSERKIYDITGRNNLTISNIKSNNGNLIIDDNYLDIGLNNYEYSNISAFIRFKVNDIDVDKLSFITNNKISYSYDVTNKQFIFTNGNQVVASTNYLIEPFRWYTIGYTYDGHNISMYVDGTKIYSGVINGSISNGNSFKIGTDQNFNTSNIIVDQIYIYNSILNDEAISNNFKETVTYIEDNLLCGYNEFTPMTKKEYYISSPSGTVIDNNDINSQYVWIPRFKYVVWNVLGDSTVTSDITSRGVTVAFEKGNMTSGNIYCQNSKCYSDEKHTIQVTSNDNNKYYAHVAFNNESTFLTGFWVSKYEIGTTNNCQGDACISPDFQVVSNENTTPWVNNYLANYYQAVKRLGDNYHLIKNSEWGAISYLTYSKYGICMNNNCVNDAISSTNNKYGVYNMASGPKEFVMASLTDENQELLLTNTHFANINLNPTEIDTYYSNNFILGDATKEISTNNNNLTYFTETNRWLTRGGNNSVFNYEAVTDTNYQDVTSRIIIK